PAVDRGPDAEKAMVRGAVATDFILSAEIMVIALGEVAAEPLGARAVILLVVGLVITVLVYGVVALIVKMDDVGLHLSARDPAGGSGRCPWRWRTRPADAPVPTMTTTRGR